MPRIKNFSISFYLLFESLNTLTAFKDFLETWSDQYRIQEGILQCSTDRRTPFQVHFTISGKDHKTGIKPEKVCELIKYISDRGIFRDEEVKINQLESCASIQS